MALKKARRAKLDAGLNITSMMDMMTIILVFLLKSYSTQDISVAPSEDLELPVSTTAKPPEIAVNLVVTKSRIVVDGKNIVNLVKEDDPQNPGQMRLAVPQDERRGQVIPALQEELEEKAEKGAKDAQAMQAASGKNDHAFKGRLLIQCDKKLPFRILRKVMYTAGQAQFSEFKFIVYKQDQ